jgi:hypothetical protein
MNMHYTNSTAIQFLLVLVLLCSTNSFAGEENDHDKYITFLARCEHKASLSQDLEFTQQIMKQVTILRQGLYPSETALIELAKLLCSDQLPHVRIMSIGLAKYRQWYNRNSPFNARVGETYTEFEIASFYIGYYYTCLGPGQ